MKAIIDLGITILLLGTITKNLPSILSIVRKGQIIFLQEASVTTWGKAWVPSHEN